MDRYLRWTRQLETLLALLILFATGTGCRALRFHCGRWLCLRGGLARYDVPWYSSVVNVHRPLVAYL